MSATGLMLAGVLIGTAYVLAAAEAPAPVPVRTGDAVTYVYPGTVDRWCARVADVRDGTAWVIPDADTRRVFHVPVGDLFQGCTP